MSIRTERVARLLQREIADLLGTEFADQIHPMVTVTGARMTGDLGIVYIYVSVLGDSDSVRQSTLAHLRTLAPRIRTALAARIRHQLRAVPDMKFFLDETLEQAQRMESLFDRIRSEKPDGEED